MPPPPADPRAFQLVVAAGRALGIGKGGGLPWKLAGDMAYFRDLTTRVRGGGSGGAAAGGGAGRATRNAVVMGRKTWESLPARFRPLPDRLNVVLSRSAGDENGGDGGNGGVPAPSKLDLPPGVLAARSLDAALALLASPPHAADVETVFVIGGGAVYEAALASPACVAVHLTRVDSDAPCDTFFPALDPAAWRLWGTAPPKQDGGVRYQFEAWVRAGARGPPGGAWPPAAAPVHGESQV
jgi:dihydrofolate reductase/thymidylate synthase